MVTGSVKLMNSKEHFCLTSITSYIMVFISSKYYSVNMIISVTNTDIIHAF